MKPGKQLLSLNKTYIGKSRSDKREAFINDLVEHFQWTVGAEIGVRTGRTSFHLLDSSPNLSMFAIDIDISQFYTATASQKYQSRLKAIEGVSWEVADQIPDGSLDFFFIDAGHGYKSVMKDIAAWVPKLKTTGWFLGHDINFPAVHRAVTDSFGKFEIGPDNVWFKSPNNDYSMLEKLK
jgi:predicted O-methyltransferase YrrM